MVLHLYVSVNDEWLATLSVPRKPHPREVLKHDGASYEVMWVEGREGNLDRPEAEREYTVFLRSRGE